MSNLICVTVCANQNSTSTRLASTEKVGHETVPVEPLVFKGVGMKKWDPLYSRLSRITVRIFHLTVHSISLLLTQTIQHISRRSDLFIYLVSVICSALITADALSVYDLSVCMKPVIQCYCCFIGSPCLFTFEIILFPIGAFA